METKVDLNKAKEIIALAARGEKSGESYEAKKERILGMMRFNELEKAVKDLSDFSDALLLNLKPSDQINLEDAKRFIAEHKRRMEQ